MSDCEIIGNEQCFCSCHRTKAMHIVACCVPCFICGRNINFSALDQHKRRCFAYTLTETGEEKK